MICLELSVNGKKLATAGLAKLGVVSSTITWVQRRDEEADSLHLHLGGLDSSIEPGVHLAWVSESLVLGDTVTVRVLENAPVDRPKYRSPKPKRATRRAIFRAELKDLKKRKQMLLQELTNIEKRTQTLLRELANERPARAPRCTPRSAASSSHPRSSTPPIYSPHSPR